MIGGQISDEASETSCRVACLSDTYGLESNNGVGRFLQDLRRMAGDANFPLTLFVPGKGGAETGLHRVRAPSFALPGYPDVQLSVPLEHHRKTILRELKAWRPDVMHVSTPGPFGCFGITIARQLKLPLVGIYHTDFPRYARDITVARLNRLLESPERVLDPLRDSLSPLYSTRVQPVLRRMEEGNPEFAADIGRILEILQRNYAAASDGRDIIQRLGDAAHAAMVDALRRFYGRFTLIVARSEAQRSEIEQAIHCDPQRIRCLSPGTDTEKFHPRHRNDELRLKFGIPSEALIVLYVGRLSAEKNFDFLLNVWRRVAGQEEGPEVRLVLVGRGEPGAADRACEVPSVHVLGPQQGEQLSAIYASADLVLFPSTTETLGQVGLEAGASGLPVVVADQGGPQHYVLPGETGYVLPVDDPQPWADLVHQLATDPDTCRQIGRRARTHVEQHYSLAKSLQSYREIHSEAVELNRRARRARIRRSAGVRKSRPAPSRQDRPGLLVVTDYHAGKRYGTAKHRVQKEAALEKMLALAAAEGLDVVYGGDFGDHSARPDRLEEDFLALRRVQRRVGLTKLPLMIRGNHDYGFSDEQLTELTGGCEIHGSLVYAHRPSGVTITHGHVLGLHQVLELIRKSTSPQSLEAALTEDRLDQELKPSVIAYDLANLIESYVQQRGLSGLGAFWEGLFRTRTRLAERLLTLGDYPGRPDAHAWRLIASLVGSYNDVEVAGLLGGAMGSWATVFGHTHDPLARRVTLPSENQQQIPVHIVANAGNINRKRPSCVVARFPSVTVYRYSHDRARLRISRRSSLTLPESTRYSRSPSLEENRSSSEMAAAFADVPKVADEQTTSS